MIKETTTRHMFPNHVWTKRREKKRDSPHMPFVTAACHNSSHENTISSFPPSSTSNIVGCPPLRLADRDGLESKRNPQLCPTTRTFCFTAPSCTTLLLLSNITISVDIRQD
ncbi:hypothetical protein FRC18_009038 [Serendipita sp. 400]|nr:hypothetical protein FRC18_009038 [Serendipita sp. 400]